MALISSKYKQSVTGYGYNNNGYFMHFLQNKSDVLPLCPIISLKASATLHNRPRTTKRSFSMILRKNRGL